MNFKLQVLPSGLRLLTVPMKSSESVTVTVWVKTGSRYENEKNGGISHFLEHMVFKGSKKRPTAKAISEVVDSFGGEFNAATSKDWTNFYIKSRVANLDIAMDVLSDMVLNPILSQEEIDREKGTILQEMSMYNDTPMMKIGDVFEELAFEGNTLAMDTIGTEKSVKSVKRPDFMRYRDIHYYADNMLVSVVGGVTESTSLKLVKKYFSDLKSKKSENKFKIFKSIQKSPKFKLNTKKSEQANLILGFMSEGRGYKNRFAQSLLSVILGSGMSSRLFTEIRERRGLAYSVRSSFDRYQDIGYFGVYAGVNVQKINEAITVMLDQIYGVANGKLPITDKEFKKAKEFLKGHLALSLEDTKDVDSFFGEQALFLDEILTPEEIFKRIDKVKIEDLVAEAKKTFVKERLNLAIIGPYKNKEKFKKLLE